MQKFILLLACSVSVAAIFSCNNEEKKLETPASALLEKDVPYSLDSINMIGFAAYDSAVSGKRPVVLVVHEWWGLNDYAQMRVKELAKLGYLAFAVDMYGNRAQGIHPDSAKALAMPFYMNPQMAKARFDAALATVKTFAEADTTKIAAIGYCFGGSMVLNAAKLGDDLRAVVSFHGGLQGVPANKDLLKAKILVCHGAADSFVPQAEVDLFRQQLDSIGATYSFKTYDSATHAFSNPNATEIGKKFNLPISYNAKADSASWSDMQAFFKTIF